MPENTLWVKSATIIPNEQQQIVYYTASDPVTLAWAAVADEGTKPHVQSEGETVSGTAGYDLWADNDFTAPIASVSDAQEPGVPDGLRQAVVQIAEGSQTVYLTAKDNADMDSRYSYSDMQKTNPDHPNFNSLCRILVDRTGPAAPSNLRLSDPLAVAGKGDFAPGLAFTLAWNAAADLPTGKNAGIGRYEIILTNTSVTPNTVTTIPVNDPNAVSAQVTLAANGRYSAKIRAYDKAGNAGAESAAYIFNVDTAAPVPPPAASFGMVEPGSRQLDGEAVVFTTVNEAVTLTFARATGEAEEWQSGVASYELRKLQVINGQSTEIAVSSFAEPEGTGNLTLAISGLALGATEHKLYAFDRAGNGASVSIRILRTQLSAVTFPEYFYVRENGEYRLVWDAPELAPPGATLYYKAIVKLAAGEPSAAEWDASAVLTERRSSLAGQPLGEYLYAYVLVGDNFGDTNVSLKRFKLPAATVPEGEDHEITETEIWWSGVKEIHANVIVRPGATLHVEAGCVIRLFGNVKLVIEGTLDVNGEAGSRVTFEANVPGYAAWQGIHVTGAADIRYADIKHARRGVSVINNAAVTIADNELRGCRVGLHVYNAHPTVTGTRFTDCQWYGMKEDAIPQGGPRPKLAGCVFTQNGYDYYHDRLRDIGMDTLNGIGDNGGNRKE